MTELLTAAQMRAIEAAAIASGEVTGLELMERAGRGVVEAIFEEWPVLRATSHRAVVLCGPGNNGGDGFVVARLLKEWGWEVEVFLYGTPEGMPSDARVNYERWAAMGKISALVDVEIARLIESGLPSITVDALFGTGLTRGIGTILRETSEALWMEVSLHGGRVVAVDIPSGICADSGRDLGRALPATLTVSFNKKKIGHFIAEGPVHSYRTVVADIGLKDHFWHGRVSLTEASETYLQKTGSLRQHKFSHGHALILSGPPGQCGAARLAARGALRIGAGVVTLACPPDALLENAARLDAIMVRPWGTVGGLQVALDDGRINAICVGPGLGLDLHGEQILRGVLCHKAGTNPKAMVLDADALTLLSRDPALFALLHETCVLTPHGGEFARLFPDIAAKLEAPASRGPAYSKVDATREAAARAGCVVLFKGPDTVIADPSGRCAINSAAYDRAAPWLATAGSGDVLAGFITGLLARGFEPFEAACSAAWLHVECARSFGPGLIAEDLPEELPKVFRALGL